MGSLLAGNLNRPNIMVSDERLRAARRAARAHGSPPPGRAGSEAARKRVRGRLRGDGGVCAVRSGMGRVSGRLYLSVACERAGGLACR